MREGIREGRRTIPRFAAPALTGLAAACLLASLAQAAKARPPKKPLPVPIYTHDGSLADRDILYVGRWDRSAPTAYHSHWGGAYLRATFTGTTIGFRGGATAGGTTVLVSVDGEPPHEVSALDSRRLKAGVHTLLLGSPGQNREFDFKGLVLGAGSRTLPTPARPLVEFVGDSITTGGG